MPIKPKTTIIYAGSELTTQDYPNLEVICEETDKPAELFNRHIEQGFGDSVVVGFMGRDYDFTMDNAVSLMVDKLSDAAIIGAVYADLIVENVIDESSTMMANQYLPAFHANLLSGHIPIMSPVFIKTNLLTQQRFHPKLKKLYHWLFFLTISQNILSAHIPLPLFKRHQVYDANTTTASDYKYIQQWLTQQDT